MICGGCSAGRKAKSDLFPGNDSKETLVGAWAHDKNYAEETLPVIQNQHQNACSVEPWCLVMCCCSSPGRATPHTPTGWRRASRASATQTTGPIPERSSNATPWSSSTRLNMTNYDGGALPVFAAPTTQRLSRPERGAGPLDVCQHSKVGTILIPRLPLQAE
eukprot:CAMPEP_0175949284 /NCGR_PEP_ID=MMETSP0108-20121206/28942_1 /TAXON_ID=195067 ORGANISM="Goniomonas pacifica, Strain CCMP1869" /NCGR_SAMPLE_ID=MMETSP0108 /ASSEMBLY_ACC=CAM_ASM_000204 /LENGTH=161 /DNA_ID=CAMNT_0017275181 /DNA_START=176 /DNA_END=662 /DNA_ORIENTATION=+